MVEIVEAGARVAGCVGESTVVMDGSGVTRVGGSGATAGGAGEVDGVCGAARYGVGSNLEKAAVRSSAPGTASLVAGIAEARVAVFCSLMTWMMP